VNDITESLIARAGLTPEEAKVARVLYELKTAGKRTKRWVENLPARKYNSLLESGQRKIKKALAET